MNKHWLGLILFTVNTSCMEDEASTYKTTFDFFPPEIVHHMVEVTTQKGKKTYFSEGGYVVVIPHPLFKNSLHQVKLHKMSLNCSTMDTWMPSTNLNAVQGKSSGGPNDLFSVQCWYCFGRKFRIDDNVKKSRYLKTLCSGDVFTQCYFDGPNDNGLLLLGMDRNEFCSVEYIGIFPKPVKYNYKKRTCDVNESVVLHERISIDTLHALALCKTKNRYVSVDEKKINIFDIFSKKLPVVGESELFGEHIKKISFLTQKTLLGITATGRLHTFALDEKRKTIKNYKQAITNKSGKEVVVKNFAVDACYPYHILLHTENNTMVVWNFDSYFCFPIGTFTKVLDYVDARELWFYDNVFCFVNDNNIVSRYKLDFFALKKFDEENNCWVGD